MAEEAHVRVERAEHERMYVIRLELRDGAYPGATTTLVDKKQHGHADEQCRYRGVDAAQLREQVAALLRGETL